jgi:hypothetical protein
MKGWQAATAPAAIAVWLLVALCFAGTASADPLGDFARFKWCPWTVAEVDKCLYSATTGGEVVLGKKTVPIVKPITLQAGVSASVAKFSKVFAATNGVTLAKVPQPVPGGLAGLVPDASSDYLVKSLIKFFFSNGLTGVNLTPELAKPASEIHFSKGHLLSEEGVALELPLKFRLENPFLGKRCYVGSEAVPVMWNLTTGETSPPGPNKPIEGSAGKTKFLGGGEILHQDEAELVDNAWEAPPATGCGGVIAFLVDPIVNAQLGSLAAGYNTAILPGTIDIADAEVVELCAATDCS